MKWFDPVIFTIPYTGLEVRYYGLMYVLGFLLGGYLCKRLAKEKFFKVPPESVDGLITHLLIGMFLGARTFYVFIYNWDYYSQNMSELLAVWKGGLSFHGAIVGLAVGAFIFARKNKVPFLQVSDACCTAGTQGIFWGRVGNFINGELYGRVTDVSWGFVFPGGGPYPRHPSQLYEGITEGLILFAVLWFSRKKVKYYGILTAIFFMGYSVFRYIVEFFREADSQLGYYFGGTTTMGQILCIIMFFFGIGIIFYSKKRKDILAI